MKSTTLAAAAIFLLTPLAPAEEAPPPKVFSDFKEALAHAAPRNQKVFVALIHTGEAESEVLATLLADTGLYLNGERVVIHEYRIEDASRADSFRAHFRIEEANLPLVVVVDGSGKPLGHKAGLLREFDYYSFIENTAGFAALSLPAKVRLRRGIAASMSEAATGKEKYHTPMRKWTLVSGESFEGAVVESTGDEVVFELADGELRQVGANTLARDDFEFLRKALNGGMFGVREADLVGSVALTEMRTWTTVTGQKITAALMEAKGATGIFRSEAGKLIEIGFNTLSRPDLDYLKDNKVLEVK